jgi:uncharacterized tellurite resistance protein B-like protein
MSFFNKSHENAGPLTFTGEESVVALLFLVVTADGSIAPEEEELVIATSNRMQLLRKLSIDDFNDVVQKVRDAIDGSGRDAVFGEAVKGMPGDLKETVFALAADVVFADAQCKTEEIEYLRKVQEALGVPDELATKVVEVMRLKNRG